MIGGGQSLGGAIDLIIKIYMRKSKQLGLIIGKPRHFPWKKYQTTFEFRDWIDIRVFLSRSGLTAMAVSPASLSSFASAVPMPVSSIRIF